MINVKTFIFNPFYENTYLAWDEITKETIIIDPGCYGETEEAEIKAFIEVEKLKIKYLVNTHCHIDHVMGNNFIIKNYKPEFYLPENDLPLLKNIQKQGDMFGIKLNEPVLSDKFLSESLHLYLGETLIEFLFTPGHSPGEYCVLFREEKICFSGDVLFKESIGRTDLWGGNYDTLICSIENKLLTLDENTIIYPGHGESTTIQYESEKNSFLL